MDLKDKVAIITGGGRGIGRQYALGFIKEGAKVVIADLDLENARTVVKEIEEEGGEALAIKTDISRQDDTQEMAAKTIEKFGRIDILVNNAAYMAECDYKPIEAWTIEEWDRCFAVNARGTWLASTAVIPRMKSQKKGKIINIITGLVFHGPALLLPYPASKGAVMVMTRCMARELGNFGICVNSLSPGYFPTTEGINAIKGKPPGFDLFIIAGQSFKKQGNPKDMVGTCIFLASDQSDFVTGQLIECDGGLAMH